MQGTSNKKVTSAISSGMIYLRTMLLKRGKIVSTDAHSDLYEETLNLVRLLSIEEQLLLLEELARIIRHRLSTSRSEQNITEPKEQEKN